MADNQQLLDSARRGDGDAFGQLCAPLAGMVYRHCLHMLGQPADAQDAAQEAMVRAYRALPRFVGRASFATWLYRIAHNTCLDILKRPARQREAASVEAMAEEGRQPVDRGPSPEEHYLRQAQAQALGRAVARLPRDQQALVALRYGEGLSYEDLAQATGLRVGTVKSKLSRAKARLRQLLPMEDWGKPG